MGYLNDLGVVSAQYLTISTTTTSLGCIRGTGIWKAQVLLLTGMLVGPGNFGFRTRDRRFSLISWRIIGDIVERSVHP